jgi:lauroyl/myristoyl acyltransferase
VNPRPAFQVRDLVLVGALLSICPIAWLVPEHEWARLAQLMSRLALSRRVGQQWLSNLQGAFNDPDSAAARRIVIESGTNLLLKHLQLLRSYRIGGWRPRIHLDGRENIEFALTAGKGIILWTSPFRFADLVVKIGMHEAGYPLTHLSAPGHPWSDSRFGRRCLNPFWVHIEQRYLKERVVLDLAHPKRAVEHLRRVLEANGIVNISAVRGATRRPATIRLLNAHFRLGLGAPLLSYDTGAALLPTFVLHQFDGSFRIVVEGPIPVHVNNPRIEEAITASEALARRTEPYIRSAPGQWSWSMMEPIGPN